MATVPYIFANQTGPIPLSELDANFANVKASATTAISVTSNAQPNITSVGTLTSVSVSGNVTAGNVGFGSGTVTGTGNIVAGNFVGNVAFGAGIVSGGGNIATGNLTVTRNAIIVGNLTVQGTTTSLNSNTITTNDLTITVGNNQSTGVALNNAGLLVGSSNIATWRFNNATTSWQSNIGITPLSASQLNLGDNSLPWANLYVSNINNVNINATGNATIAGILNLSGNAVITSNVTAGNIRTNGIVSAAGNVTGGNINTVGGLYATIVSASGNIVTGTGFVGSGAGLTGIAANLTVGNSAIAITASALTTTTFTISESFGVLYFKHNNVNIATLDSAGNFTVKGNITAQGNVTAFGSA
jgi:hypothetical protein